MDPYATHQEALMAALSAHPGDVLELGCGHFSTPIIRAVTKAHGKKFVIAASDKVWFEKFRGQCDELIEVANWRKWVPQGDYAVCLLDNEQFYGERYKHLPALLERCRCVVVHDADRYARFPGWDELLARTPHVWYRKQRPHTVVLTPRPSAAAPGANEAANSLAAAPPVLDRPAVLVCRSGREYSALHVHWLARQLPGQVSVLTDLPAEQFAGLHVIPLRHLWPGRWAKMELFRPDILTCPVLYLDLDTVVRSIPAPWYDGAQLKCPRGFRRRDRLQSGLMMIPPAAKAEIWKAWIKDPAAHMKAYRSEQDFIAAHATEIEHFPLEDVSSYKLTPARTVQAKVVYFHGRPRPWACGEAWVPPLETSAWRPANPASSPRKERRSSHMTADDICRAAWPRAEWSRVDAEADLLARMFVLPTQSLVRLGDGELNLLRRGDGDSIARELRRAALAAGVLGLPENFNGQVHPWRTALREQLAGGGDVASEPPVISAILPLFRPSIIARIARGRRVLWITHKASVIVQQLKFPEFCQFYGFDEGRTDVSLDTVPGRALPTGVRDPLALARATCAALETREFDLAIIGMGALGKLLVRHVAQEMGRSALDAGCILSAFRGDGNDRRVFQRQLKELVWITRR